MSSIPTKSFIRHRDCWGLPLEVRDDAGFNCNEPLSGPAPLEEQAAEAGEL